MSPDLENCMEAVFRLSRQEGFARLGLLAQQLNVRASALSRTIWKLVDMDYLESDRYEIIRLTEKGRPVGEYLLTRRQTVEDFFSLLGAAEPSKEAERMGHLLTAETLRVMKRHLLFFRQNPEVEKRLQHFIQGK